MPDESEYELTIEHLYPDLNPEQQVEAEKNLLGYMQAVWKVYERRFRIKDTDDFSQVMDRITPTDEE
jgi:hypothetical protein